MNFLFKIAVRNIFRNKRRSLMTGSAVAAGALAMLLFGAFTTYLFAGFETNLVQRIGHLTVNRAGFFLYGAGNPTAYAIDDYQATMDLIAHDAVLAPMINVLTATQSLAGIAGNFSGENDAAKTFIGIGLVPSNRDRMRQWDQFKIGAAQPPDLRLSDADETRGVMGLGLARILGLCARLGLAELRGAAAQPEIASAAPPAQRRCRSELSRRWHIATPSQARRRTPCRGSTSWPRPPAAPRMSSASMSPAPSRRESRNSTTTTSRCTSLWRSNSSMDAASTRSRRSCFSFVAARICQPRGPGWCRCSRPITSISRFATLAN